MSDSSRLIQDRINQFPRIPLCRLPTPLEQLPRLTKQLNGPQLWLKRDDGIGPGLGGNKGRKLEFLLADALHKRKDKIITFGGLQSNHARMTAAACAQLGLSAHLFFFEKRPTRLDGNLMLDALCDAKLHFIPFGGSGAANMTLEMTNRLVRIIGTLLVGADAYFMPVGGHTVYGCLGYVAAALEIQRQVAALGLENEAVTVVTAVGTGGTLAGLMAGFNLINSPIQVLGLDIGKLWRGFPASIARLASALCAVLGLEHTFAAEAVPMIAERYAGPGYARLTPETVAAMRQLAQNEGVLLDPVYTGKAFAGLLDLIEKGLFQPSEHLIFLHSGGFPGIWAYEEKLL